MPASPVRVTAADHALRCFMHARPAEKDCPVSLVTILLIILIVLAFGGGNFGFGGAYRGPGNILGLVLTILLVILLVRAIQSV